VTLDATPVIAAVSRAVDAGVRATDAGLKGVEVQVEAPAPRRPTWQRWLLPVFGTLLVLAGIALFWLPFTNLLIVIGLPLMFCFSRRYENAARQRMRRVVVAMRGWLPRRRGHVPRVRAGDQSQRPQ
jgi:hypothetical protein